jgi:hypothetical protein
MSTKKFFIAIIIISLLIPYITNAQIKISEIMYDPDGTDTKREWIEVINTGTTDIDLNTYFFFENNVFHKLVAQDVSILLPGEYAIIVDSIAEVVADYMGYMGKIFDSAFSLNNTGETISIANNAKEIINTVTYASDMGGSSGHSLQITDGQIITAMPTFGSVNKTQSESQEEEKEEDDSSGETSGGNSNTSSGSTHIQQETILKYTPSADFKVDIGRDRIVTLHTPIQFEAHVSKDDVSPKFLWNFGDFNTEKGKKTTHTYEYPGTHELILEAKAKDYKAIDRVQVKVIEPNLSIVQATTTIAITNTSKKEVNIGGFTFVFSDKTSITSPVNTIIAGGGTVHLPNDSLKVLQSFEYPNDEIYQRFDTI